MSILSAQSFCQFCKGKLQDHELQLGYHQDCKEAMDYYKHYSIIDYYIQLLQLEKRNYFMHYKEYGLTDRTKIFALIDEQFIKA